MRNTRKMANIALKIYQTYQHMKAFRLLGLWAWFTVSQITLFAQDDPVLFSVHNKPIHVSEFNYIYTKNNGDKADYSRASLEEYLDLYVKFKLKVQKALDMGLDTVKTLQEELETYRKQLSNSYLSDHEVVDQLVKEAYERMKTDVRVAHILISITSPQGPKDTLVAYNEAQKIRQSIVDGDSFENMAKQFSDDRNSSNQGGEIGYVQAMLPNGYYAMETAIYSLQKGQISYPVRSPLGYHIIKVIDTRAARGEVEAAHLLIRKSTDQNKNTQAKRLVDSLHQAILKGVNFEGLATQYSEDRQSAPRGGNIGMVSINQYDAEFENAVFALTADGQVTKPVETSVGWHIIKRVRKMDLQPFDQMKNVLKARIEQDSRVETAKSLVIDRILAEAKFTENKENYMYYQSLLDSSFLTYRWRTPGSLRDRPLFTFGSENTFGTSQFSAYLFKNTRERVRLAPGQTVESLLMTMFKSFVRESALQYEEKNLKDKYPEFKNLMREYEEGIMLFEATKLEVWDKATFDTTGLAMYYDKNKSKFMWGPRADLYTVVVQDKDAKMTKKILNALAKKPVEEVAKTYNIGSEIVTYTSTKYEQGAKEVEGMVWKKKAMSAQDKNGIQKTVTVKILDNLSPSTAKSIDEARGYVIADYQDFLEKQWVSSLHQQYKVDINKAVFESLVRK